MEKKYNTRSPAVKRLMREAAEMSIPTSDYFAAPLEDNLFEWHFTVRGPEDTEFQTPTQPRGDKRMQVKQEADYQPPTEKMRSVLDLTHSRATTGKDQDPNEEDHSALKNTGIPTEYPMKPPDIIVLTPNGRFEVGKKICLSISGFHPETWQPSWSIRTALLAIIGFMPTPGQGTIGSLDYTPDERKTLARRSVDWCCTQCGTASTLLLPPSQEKNEEQKEEMEKIVQSVAFKSEEEVAQLKKTSAPAEAASSADAASEPAAASAAASAAAPPSASSASSPSSSSTPAAPPRRRAVGNSNSPNNRGQANVESRGVQVYDVLIMLLVAAIAALLARRINLMQDSESGSNFPAQE